MEVLLGIITTYSFIQVIVIICILFLFQLIYMKLTDDDYYSDLRDIRSKFKARMWAYLAGELRVIEAMSLNRVEEILELYEFPEDKDKRTEFTMFGLILERTLQGTLFESLKNAIRLNGFHDMNVEELEIYVTDKSNVLLRESRKGINERMMYYPSLRGTDEKRFTLEEAHKFLMKIVKKSIKLHNQEKAERKLLKKRYSLWTKINLIGALINKFKSSDK